MLTRALAAAPVQASYCQAPRMAYSARLRPTACSVLSDCRASVAEAAPSSRARVGPIEARVVSPLHQARSTARLLPAGAGSEAWRPSARPRVATTARASSQQPALATPGQ